MYTAYHQSRSHEPQSDIMSLIIEISFNDRERSIRYIIRLVLEILYTVRVVPSRLMVHISATSKKESRVLKSPNPSLRLRCP